jgi:integral membrane sensor domain MASE1
LAALAWAAVSLPAFWAALIWSIIACFIAVASAVGVTFRRLATSLR